MTMHTSALHPVRPIDGRIHESKNRINVTGIEGCVNLGESASFFACVLLMPRFPLKTSDAMPGRGLSYRATVWQWLRFTPPALTLVLTRMICPLSAWWWFPARSWLSRRRIG